MTNETIIALIDAEILKLTEIRSLLANTGKIAAVATASLMKNASKPAPAKKTRKRRVLSAEARKRIADAQRKRWAAQRASGKAKAK